MTARALCMTIPDPFRPAAREIRVIRGRPRIRKLAPRTDRPFIALVNGRPLMRAGWRRRVRAGEVVSFVVLPRGGGGGSNPLAMILSLAVLAFAPYAAGFALSALGLSASQTLIAGITIGAVAEAAFTFVGLALVNLLIPKPQAPTPQQIAGPSPTYSLQAQGNVARLGEAIPVQYGRLRVYPDFAARPYVAYEGNEQYLYQLLCIGQGEFDVEAIQIEDTPVSSFAEIETEIIGPTGEVSLFPANVITSAEVSGQRFAGKATGTYAQSGTTVTVTETGHGRAVGQAVNLDFTSGGAPDGVYAIATIVNGNNYTVEVGDSATRSGDVDIFSVIGGVDGFVGNPAGTTGNRIAVDLLYPRGLYFAEANGTLTAQTVSVYFEARRIDDDGTPLGSWTSLGTVSITSRTTTPRRISRRWVPSQNGRFAVRGWRTDVENTGASYGHEATWAGLRIYLRNTKDYGPVTLLAMRMRASNNLSAQASRRVNVICTRKLPVWNGSTWSAPQPTASIAWALADAARNAVYGAGMDDAEIDLSALLALDAVWSARGDEFNGRWDQGVSWWEAASKIAAAGRARVFLQGGILRVVRDAQQTVPVAAFSMRNILRNSFSIDYIMPTEDTADSVEVGYFDRQVWAPRRIVAGLSGSEKANPEKIELFGVTDRAHALREGLYHAASNAYRRRVVRFATEMEGFIPSIGDLIAIQHDMPQWGQSAEVIALDGDLLTVSELLEWGSGSHYVGFRGADGGLVGPYAVSQTARQDQLVLADESGLDAVVYTGGERERTHLVFGTAEMWRVLAKVIAVRPRGLHEVEIEAVTEDDRVHEADGLDTAPAIGLSALPAFFTLPAISGFAARFDPNEASRVLLSWNPAPGADLYQIEMAEGDDAAAAAAPGGAYSSGFSPAFDGAGIVDDSADGGWTRVGDTTSADYAVSALYAARTMIRIRGVGVGAGPWMTTILGDLIPFMWTTDSATMWSVTDTDPMWG